MRESSKPKSRDLTMLLAFATPMLLDGASLLQNKYNKYSKVIK